MFYLSIPLYVFTEQNIKKIVEYNVKLTVHLIKQFNNIYSKIILSSRELRKSAHNNKKLKKFLTFILFEIFMV